MGAWVTITTGDLDNYLVGAQALAIRTSALAQGQTDTFSAVMTDRVNYVRNRIAGRVRVSATPLTVPPELQTQATLLVMEALQARLTVLDLTEDQKTLIARAYKDLDLAGTPSFPLTAADDAEAPDVSPTGSIQVASKITRNSTWEQLRSAGL